MWVAHLQRAPEMISRHPSPCDALVVPQERLIAGRRTHGSYPGTLLLTGQLAGDEIVLKMLGMHPIRAARQRKRIAFTALAGGASLLSFAAPSMAFDMSANTNDDTVDTIPIAFVNVFFDTDNLPSMNLANTCNPSDNKTFTGSDLPDCSTLNAGIKTCQTKGKTVTISVGGASGSIGFTSDSQAQTFAQTIWDLYLGGSSQTRPFGDVVLDGVDIDIEGGSSTGYSAFVTAIRKLMDADTSKTYYITAAPQCQFPDAYLGTALNEVAFDAVYVQFYNNFCGVKNYNNANAWNFATWDDWAKNTSINKNVKIYIGAPASNTATTDPAEYVDPATLTKILQDTKAQYSSFGGAMLWDMSQAYTNDRFDKAIKAALGGGSSPSSSSVAPSSTSTFPSSSSSVSAPASTSSAVSTSAPASTSSAVSTSASATSSATSSAPSPTSTSSGSCTGVAAWVSTTAYTGGQQATYNGHLWTAKWWTQADTPGGTQGDWTDDGACASQKKRTLRHRRGHY
ncbi:glycoside hydrolase family 18 protein [Coniophora puteana RWD-64-598 SS2]|uniref:chitinase n=1 Tax=Coniophora puteana (strain RWD-64-598) TaxID=741705 RepID=A0A5M3MAD8_CONPW|nr:glycoside hydrolase family 18 protein [Coniophora puteana RWD-64-598 SS2]EIW75611.1 glycoside hydrolase family 18 protein [Coniophora puteana RWD-64-598 SS2]